MATAHGYDLEKMAAANGYDFAKMDKQQINEMIKIDKNFGNALTLSSIESARAAALQGARTGSDIAAANAKSEAAMVASCKAYGVDPNSPNREFELRIKQDNASIGNKLKSSFGSALLESEASTTLTNPDRKLEINEKSTTPLTNPNPNLDSMPLVFDPISSASYTPSDFNGFTFEGNSSEDAKKAARKKAADDAVKRLYEKYGVTP